MAENEQTSGGATIVTQPAYRAEGLDAAGSQDYFGNIFPIMIFKATNMNRAFLLAVFTFTTLSLAGCQLDDSNDSSTGTPPETRIAGKLVKTDQEGLTAWFREALAANTDGSANTDLMLAGEAVAAADSSGAERQVSTTNLQEAGVDEADLLKTASDGSVLYALYSRSSPYLPGPIPVDSGKGLPDSGRTDAGIRVMAVNNDGSLDELTTIPSAENGLQQKGLYLVESRQRLLAIDESGGYVYTNWFRPWYFTRQQTGLRFIDIADPASTNVVRNMTFDGALVASRRVGDVIYLVLRHYPDFPVVADSTDERSQLSTISAATLLPHYRIDGVDQGLLVAPDACYLNIDAATKTADIVSIVAVDLSSDQGNIQSRCYVGASEAVYASTKALYLASTRYAYQFAGDSVVYDPAVTTDIHKFTFNGMDIAYRGSAEVKGHLGWKQDQKSFRFSESADGYLRVLTYNEPRQRFIRPVDDGIVIDETTAGNDQQTSTTAPDSSPVQLTILKESATRDALDVVSTLPNAQRPEHLGRPGEQLYGTRYIGDRAYLITFRVTDPLYVVDLSNPSDPYIAGELKISGYSDYLHPITENLLLGIGKEAVPAAATFPGDIAGAWYQGIKLSLIDVSDPTTPREVETVEIGKRGSQSIALQEHHAITTLKVGDTLRVTLPIERHDTPSQYGDPTAPNYYWDYSHTALYRFDIDIPSQQIDTTLPPLVVADRSTTDIARSTWHDRSALIGEHVHYLHDGRFWSQQWHRGGITGPQ